MGIFQAKRSLSEIFSMFSTPMARLLRSRSSKLMALSNSTTAQLALQLLTANREQKSEERKCIWRFQSHRRTLVTHRPLPKHLSVGQDHQTILEEACLTVVVANHKEVGTRVPHGLQTGLTRGHAMPTRA